MKLVFATEYYHPWAPGGTAWSLELLARALIARGHPVTVVTPNYGAAATEDVNGVLVVRFPFWRRLRPGAGLAPLVDHVNPLFHLLFARALVSAARRTGADLIHAQEKHALVGAFFAARWLRKPVYLSLRDFGLICPITTCLLRHRQVPADCSAGKLQRECAPDFFRQYIRGSALRRLRIRCSLGLLYMDAWLKRALVKRVDGVTAVSQSLLDIYAARTGCASSAGTSSTICRRLRAVRASGRAGRGPTSASPRGPSCSMSANALRARAIPCSPRPSAW